MIERFNFYDVYGYLLPGLALLGLAWLPFALSNHSWPTNELLSAVAVLAFGYVLGHLLQNVASGAVPSKFNDGNGRLRRPSDSVLDRSDSTFSEEVKKLIADKVRESFQIDISVGTDGNEQLSKERDRAFLMARATLVQKQLVSYAEQFQGLYAMMRGLTVACLFGVLYLFCWALGIFRHPWLWWLAVVLFWISIASLVITGLVRIVRHNDHSSRKKVDTVTLFAIASAISSTAYLLGSKRASASPMVLAAISIILILAAARFYVAYRAFAVEFARAVWRDFAAHQKAAQSPA